MTAQKPHPMVEFLPGFPQRQPLLRALRKWWTDTCWFLWHTITPTETVLPEPARSVAQPVDDNSPPDLKERLAAAKTLVDSAEARLNTVRAKATSLLGFVALVIPLVSWWLLSGRARLSSAPIALEILGYMLMLMSGAFLFLSLLALVRIQGIVSYHTLTPDLFIDLEKGELKPHDWGAELREQALAWGSVQRWSDVVTDFFRAGQRFLILSLFAAVIAGGVSYLYPQPTKTVSLVQKPSGEIELVVDASGGVDPNSRWVAAMWNLVSFIVGGFVTLLATSLYFRKYWRPIVTGPEKKNLIRLTPVAAEKLRQRLVESRLKYLRAKAQAMSSGLPARELQLEGSVDEARDYLGESEGVDILVARDCAELVRNCLVGWTDNDKGGGFYFSEEPTLPVVAV